jgi:hypothetical protein
MFLVIGLREIRIHNAALAYKFPGWRIRPSHAKWLAKRISKNPIPSNIDL